MKKSFIIEDDFLILVRYVKTYCKIKNLSVPGDEFFYKEIYDKYNLQKEYDFNNSNVEDVLIKAYQIIYIKDNPTITNELINIFHKYVDKLVKIEI